MSDDGGERCHFPESYAKQITKDDACELIEFENADDVCNPLSSGKLLRVDVEETVANMARKIGELSAALEDALKRIEALER